jgi:hypothetical protein
MEILNSLLPSMSTNAKSSPVKLTGMPLEMLDYFATGRTCFDGVDAEYGVYYNAHYISATKRLVVTATDASVLEIELIELPGALTVDFDTRIHLYMSSGIKLRFQLPPMKIVDVKGIKVPRTFVCDLGWTKVMGLSEWRVVRYYHPQLAQAHITNTKHALLVKLQEMLRTNINAGCDGPLTTIVPVPQQCRIIASNETTYQYWVHRIISDYEATIGLAAIDVEKRPAWFEQITAGHCRAYFDLDHIKPSSLEGPNSAFASFVKRVKNAFFTEYAEDVEVKCLLSNATKPNKLGEPEYTAHIIVHSARLFRLSASIRAFAVRNGLMEDTLGGTKTRRDSDGEASDRDNVEAAPFVVDPSVYQIMQKFRLPEGPKEPGSTRVFRLVDPAAPLGATLMADPLDLLVQDFRSSCTFYDPEVVTDMGVIYDRRENAPRVSDADFETLKATLMTAKDRIFKVQPKSILKNLAQWLKKFENSPRIFGLFSEVFDLVRGRMTHNDTPGGGAGMAQVAHSVSFDPVSIWNRARGGNYGIHGVGDIIRSFQNMLFDQGAMTREGAIVLDLKFNPAWNEFVEMPQKYMHTNIASFEFSVARVSPTWTIMTWTVLPHAGLDAIVFGAGEGAVRVGMTGVAHITMLPDASGAWDMRMSFESSDGMLIKTNERSLTWNDVREFAHLPIEVKPAAAPVAQIAASLAGLAIHTPVGC